MHPVRSSRRRPRAPRALGLALLALGAALVLVPRPGAAQVEPLDYAQAADENRYLVKGKDMIYLADNMEPVMPHNDQTQRAIDKLQGKGFCVAELARTCKTCHFDSAVEAKCRRPNILIFLVDDMGWGDFGPYGGGIAYGAATPQVNRLAQEGLLLTSTYSQPTCSPSRATIHTGQLPIHHGVLYPPMYGDPGGLTVESITLPWVLKQMGYRTQGVGKWHMGENKQNLPQNVGYDDYLGFLSVSDMYTEWRDQYYNPEVVRDKERTDYMDNNHFCHYMIHAQRDGVKGDCESLAEITVPWEAKVLQNEPSKGNVNNCPIKPGNEDKKISIALLDETWAAYSEKFITDRKGDSQPWFLYHATRGCHFDNYPNIGDQRRSYARTDYSDCTSEIDSILGRLMRKLKETGQDENTLVFFSSDNGPEDEIDPHGHTPFRGGKGDTWEGGVRVPGIARWPGIIQPGRQSDGIFDQADLYATALSLAGFDYAHPENNKAVVAKDPKLVEKIKKRYLYGIDQTSFLVDDRGESSRRSDFHWYLTHFSAVRMDEFKAFRNVTMPIGLKQGYFGGLSGVTLPVSYLWVFNLQADPKEENNINIRHLWAQHLFSAEFGRFFCVLKRFEPNIGGIMPTREYLQNELIESIRAGGSQATPNCTPEGLLKEMETEPEPPVRPAAGAAQP
jgi:arylsulfatase A-like enzyme